MYHLIEFFSKIIKLPRADIRAIGSILALVYLAYHLPGDQSGGTIVLIYGLAGQFWGRQSIRPFKI